MSRPEWHTPKGQKRREQLLAAAMQVIAEQGYSAATQRAIAEAAGVPRASTHYFFDSIDELVSEAATRYLEERVRVYEAAIERLEGGGVTAEQACHEAARLLSQVSADTRSAQFDIYLNARRQTEHRRMVHHAVTELEGLARRLLAALGVDDPDEWAAAFLAVGDGFALRKVVGIEDPPERLERAFLALVDAAGR